MRTASYFLVFLVGLSTAATSQQKGPVYTPLPAVINPANAKSSLPTSIVSSVPSSQNHPQAIAEERESPAFRQQDPSLLAAKPDASPTQQYMVYYYANPNAKASTYQSQGHAGPTQPSVFSSGRWYDWVTGLGSVALIGVGSYLSYTNFASVKTRTLRELQDMNAEDAARMAKGVMRALEKVYELSSSK